MKHEFYNKLKGIMEEVPILFDEPMKKNKTFNYYGSIGIIMYIIVSLIDRAIFKIPDIIYILLMLVAIICVLIGIILDRKGR